MASTLVTATQIITTALDALGVYGVGETLSAADASDGLRRLNAMMGSWAIQTMTMPVVARQVFDITANVGTYTIGSGATFNAPRPSTGLQHASLLLNASSPAVEVPLTLLTEQMYQAISIKSQTSEQPTAVYFDPTFVTSGYGSIILWPIPTTATNDLVLYYTQALTEFSTLTTEYQIPPGYEEALSYNLAVRLAAPHARPLPDEVRRMAAMSLAQIKRTNTPMTDLSNDAAMIGGGWRGGYNIETDGFQ